MGKLTSKKKRTAKSSGVPTIERKIHFYRIHCGEDSAGCPLPFSVSPSLEHIHALAFDEGRYLAASNGAATLLWVDQLKGNARIRIGNVRRSGLPSIERKGKLTPLDIPDGAGIAEQTHMVFFPDNILGVEFNFYGPRATRLISYLVSKATDHCPEFTLLALLRQDVKERLKRLENIQLFHLKMRASFADTLAEADEDLASSFKAAANAGDAEEIEITFRAKRGSKRFLRPSLSKIAEFFAGKTSIQFEVSKFNLTGTDSETDRRDAVDVLSDALIAKKKVVLQDERLRSVNSDSAYAAINEAYAELKTELLKATGVTT